VAAISGKVSKIGYAYGVKADPARKYRFIEVKRADGTRVRHFYVSPEGSLVYEGKEVKAGEVIGQYQGQKSRSVPDHVHLEVIQDGTHINAAAQKPPWRMP
jgi:murein DD-endopeptidase MepM/ murein hydrolase activator NlpD